MKLKEIEKEAYYYDKTGMLLKGDCLYWMARFPDKSIDMILCDLPYGNTECKWDTIIPFDKLWLQYERIIKNNGAIVLTASQPFTSALIMSNPKMFKYCWVWIKNKAGNVMQIKNAPLKRHEDILVFSKYTICPTSNNQMKYFPQDIIDCDKPVKTIMNSDGMLGNRKTSQYNMKITNYPKSILEFKNDSNKLHPTQKPVALFEYLIKTYTNENEIILDNTAGVCTTAIAARNTNREWICIEKEDKYCDVSVDRIKNWEIPTK